MKKTRTYSHCLKNKVYRLKVVKNSHQKHNKANRYSGK